ncbi:acetoacetate decarboxylase family protein [Streptomyces sp. DSM 42041]|uniref:Acetoacetate decarboxylase family protein n=1 Tax=Streptomyces hazeniae TaxID=3075538 RepID=A0ABU2NPY3_9ACTN|nr:acetoacetate decarboxylase family protein [Streptomyces sp. DSM 42041]MDT0378278.1 acetoacetate decarboxylase family protein [Streptomyces sp. DSM 42041]
MPTRHQTPGAPPPEPWRLAGDMDAAVWRLPVREVPRWRLPHGARPLVVGGKVTLVTFWVDYRPPGVLAYRELLAALAVTHRGRIAGTAVAGWVDDERSLRGGRELWGIPKERGVFVFSRDASRLRARLTTADGGTVHGDHRTGVPLPGPFPVRAHLVQDVGGEAVRVPLRVTGRPYVGRRARFTVDGGGPLGFLDGRRPTATVALRGFRFAFGRAAPGV